MFGRLLVACLLSCTMSPAYAQAAAAVRYRLTFPEPEHRWMQVEASFADLGPGPLELRMSRASPGRYVLHEFAKNVYDVQAFGPGNRELAILKPDPYGWTVADHGGFVTIRYKVYGDRLDGTYLAIDTTHAHINMPAAIMWAHGLDDRPATITLEPPAGRAWKVATQLHPGTAPFEFTAPNLAYLMDSPVEFGPIVVRQFSVGPRLFRFALHSTGVDAGLDVFLKDVEKIVRQEGAIFGEYPEFESGSYTFLADYLPYAVPDGMEHRNSSVLTSAASIVTGRARLLDGIAHELFHSWNAERIRPRSLEPFDLERANMTGELWLVEGFTEYYGSLAVQRAGLAGLAETAGAIAELVDAASLRPGRLVRSAEEMSRMAPFIDAGATIDRTNWPNTVISYYTIGGAVALALDLTLRDRSEGRVSLDDYMRAMWRAHGKPAASREGYVGRPYSAAEAEARLAEVSDAAFARDFFARYIHGRDVPDYGRLLARAGLRLRPRNPGAAWWGDFRLDAGAGGPRVASLVSPNSPAYAAGLEQDDQIRQLDGERIGSPQAVAAILQRHKPGDRVQVVFVDRTGETTTATVRLVEDPHLEVVTVESTGGSLTPAQNVFREGWLGPK